jgi:hypothetical protein
MGYMITVEEAEKIILAQAADYGAEIIPFELALGRVLAENIKADRDLPPFNRDTMLLKTVSAPLKSGQPRQPATSLLILKTRTNV